MKISEIKDEEIRKKAERYASSEKAKKWRKQVGWEKLFIETNDIYFAFDWYNTAEGSDFWNDIDNSEPTPTNDPVNPKHYKDKG